MNVRLAIVLAAALPAVAMAQQETREHATAPQEHRTVPEMGGHVFLPSFIVETPFRETTFKLGLLYGTGDATGPKYDVNGPVPGQTASYTFGTLAQTFRFEYQFKEWLSAGAVVLTSMYTGIDGPSAVAVGANFGIGMGGRVKAGHRFGPVDTALIVDVSTGPEYGVLVAAAVLRAIIDHQIEPGAALQSTHSTTVNPTLTASWAPWPALGLTGNVAYVYKSLRLSDTTISDQSGVQFAVGADFDFGKISTVPIGVLAGWRITAPVGDNGIPTINDLSGGVFYTAIRELALGLEVGWRNFTLRPGTQSALDSKATVAQLGLQYYW